MKPGDRITYMCLAGIRGLAIVRLINHDGTIDIGCEVGSVRLHELTGIKVVDELRPGTACEGENHGN